MVVVKLKWNKQKFEGIDIDVDEEDALQLLRAQVQSLTKVPADRQKLLCRGKILKGDQDLAKIKEGATVVCMGTAEVLKEPAKAMVFQEDLTDDQKHQMTGALGGGLHNLGNTCYMNSSLQMLRQIPELTEALGNFATYAAPTDGDGVDKLEYEMVSSMGKLFQEQAKRAEPIIPQIFTHMFRTRFPRFAEKDPKTNNFMQQDAHETFNELLSAVARKLKNIPQRIKDEGETNWIDYLFQGEMKQITTCEEAKDADVPKVETVKFRQLSCNITSQVNHMFEGINLSLNEELESNSVALGRMAIHNRTSKISKLPRYMVVQFVRFFWKKDLQIQSKILRRVKYPQKYDVMKMCDDDLKKKLLNARKLLSADQEKALGLTSIQKEKAKKEGEGETADMDCSEEVDLDQIDTSGMYSLQAIVTHKGRDSNGGHYVGWTRKDDKEWFKYDDEKVDTCTADAAINMSGGGDWHIAYLCLYKREDDMLERRQKIADDEAKAKIEEVKAEPTAP